MKLNDKISELKRQENKNITLVA